MYEDALDCPLRLRQFIISSINNRISTNIPNTFCMRFEKYSAYLTARFKKYFTPPCRLILLLLFRLIAMPSFMPLLCLATFFIHVCARRHDQSALEAKPQ